MYVYDLKEEFYNKIIGHRVLLLVNYDIDAICACKIFQALFKCDNIPHTVIPLKGIADLKTAYDENCEEIKYVILVNCGGTVDIVEILSPEEDVVFFVIDSHKPTDVCNVFSNGQVKVLCSNGEDENVPSFEEIFKEDDNESGSDNDEEDEVHSDEEETAGETRMQRIQRKAEERMRKRKDRKLWEDNRNKLMFDYTQYSYYSRSSAVIIFELAWKLSKDSNDLLWWAIVGASEQILLDKIESSQYIIETGNLQSHVTRLTYNNQNHQQAPTGMTISLEKDVRLALYRHWNVESSLRYSAYSASRLRLWTLNGEKKLFQLLVDMGLPLAQARQAYSSMDLDLRKEFLSAIEKLAEKYSIPDIVYVSFTLKYGYRNKFCASDVVYALLAIMEHGIDPSNSDQNFQNALDALSRCQSDILKKGVESAKKILMTLGRQVQSCIEAHLIVNAGPFLYMMLPMGTGDKSIFNEPHFLGMFARWALCSYRTRQGSQPLLIAAPNASGFCLLLGVPPLSDDSTKNLFGKAFEQAAIKSNSFVNLDYFDTSVILLKMEDINKFLDALTTLLS